MAAQDRKIALQNQSQVTGIDFIYVYPSQTQLDVYFLNDPLDPGIALNTLSADQILIYNAERNQPDQEIEISGITWTLSPDGKNILRIDTTAPGDFALYRFAIDDSRVDRFFNKLLLNFKANCPSDLDCKPVDQDCAPEDWVDFPIDYQARDFNSFRIALTDFASQRYPDWKDRLEADSGVMMLEVMSALGDEMAYYQDRIGREAHLETATQRRSVRRHARLIDYPMHDGLGASTWLDVTVAAGAGFGDIPAGADIWAMGDAETLIYFEVGNKLEEILEGKQYRVYEDRNTFSPYIWDEDALCLEAGSTEIYVEDHQFAILMPGGGNDASHLLLQTQPQPGKPSKKHMVRIKEVTDEIDPLFGTQITRITWEDEDATPFEMDLELLELRGNIVPVIAGRHYTSRFIVGEDADPSLSIDPDYGDLDRAIERTGPNKSCIYLYSLPSSEDSPLVMEGEAAITALPSIHLQIVEFISPNWVAATPEAHTYRTSFLGSPSSQSQDTDFTLDDGTWRRVVGYQRENGLFIHQDYASDKGRTIRFGDGEFGQIPTKGSIFQVDYRLGNGSKGNVAPLALSNFDSSLSFIEAVSNPFAANNGEDEESIEDVKMLAPEAFRAVAYRAVRKEDYAEAAERLDWVQQAGAEFRWTGSWLSGFVTPDPLHSTEVSATQKAELDAQLNRFRQAGREVFSSDPQYANIDLEIDICLEADAFPAEVKANVMRKLFGKKGPRPEEGYFSPDRFTFGTPLRRSSLEAWIHQVPGVKAVESVRIRRRGWFDWRAFKEFEYDPGDQSIIRINNNPLYPEKGTLKLKTHGGA